MNNGVCEKVNDTLKVVTKEEVLSLTLDSIRLLCRNTNCKLAFSNLETINLVLDAIKIMEPQIHEKSLHALNNLVFNCDLAVQKFSQFQGCEILMESLKKWEKYLNLTFSTLRIIIYVLRFPECRKRFLKLKIKPFLKKYLKVTTNFISIYSIPCWCIYIYYHNNNLYHFTNNIKVQQGQSEYSRYDKQLVKTFI
jgi:hypothetical protein